MNTLTHIQQTPKQNTHLGFTLIEVIIFITIMALIGITILISMNTVLRGVSTPRQQVIALQTAKQCAEWYFSQRLLNGFTAASLTCPSNTVPSFCAAPAGYSISTTVSCTTLYGDTSPNYKTVTINVSGGASPLSLSLLLANY